MTLGKIGDESAIVDLERTKQSYPKAEPVIVETIAKVKLTPIDRKVCELVYEIARLDNAIIGSYGPYTKTELCLLDWNFEFLLPTKPRPRDYPAFYKERDIVDMKLKKIGNAATPGLIYLLQEKNLAIPGKTAFWIREIGDSRAVDPLIQVLLKSDDSYARLNSLWALKKLKDKRMVDPLITALQKDYDYQVRCEAATALGEFEDPIAIKPIELAKQKGLIDEYVYDQAMLKLKSATTRPGGANISPAAGGVNVSPTAGPKTAVQ
ncbi:MAG: HEAT repeat domain-containing protein [Planctomycetes bacterium]|nr:HEAT repeat domain-containing protein [Planctomycetota bacterium]